MYITFLILVTLVGCLASWMAGNALGFSCNSLIK